MKLKRSNKATGRLAAFASALVLVVGGAALFSPVASAQLFKPAICNQYPDLPQCQDTGPTNNNGHHHHHHHGNGPTNDNGNGPTNNLGNGPSANAGNSGTLPFTGYPLTPLILLLLILLLIGLTIRAYIAVRDRLDGSTRS